MLGHIVMTVFMFDYISDPIGEQCHIFLLRFNYCLTKGLKPYFAPHLHSDMMSCLFLLSSSQTHLFFFVLSPWQRSCISPPCGISHSWRRGGGQGSQSEPSAEKMSILSLPLCLILEKHFNCSLFQMGTHLPKIILRFAQCKLEVLHSYQRRMIT